jgi:hypothetical protein
MKRIWLAVVSAAALGIVGLAASPAEAQGYGGYGCRPGYGASARYGGYGYSPGVNIAFQTRNIAHVVPNIAYSSGFAGGGYGYGYGCDCNRYVPYGAGYVGGYQPYQQFSRPRVSFYYGY